MKNKQKCSKTEQRQDKWPETQKLELCPKSVEVRVSSQMLEIRPSLDKLDIWKSLQTTPPLFGFRQPEQIMAVTLASCFFNLEKQRHKISIAQKFIRFYHQLLEQTLVSDGSNLSPNEFSQKTNKKNTANLNPLDSQWHLPVFTKNERPIEKKCDKCIETERQISNQPKQVQKSKSLR